MRESLVLRSLIRINVSRETFNRVFCCGESFIDKGEMFVAERMMGKSHYRYVHVWNEGSFEKENT